MPAFPLYRPVNDHAVPFSCGPDALHRFDCTQRVLHKVRNEDVARFILNPIRTDVNKGGFNPNRKRADATATAPEIAGAGLTLFMLSFFKPIYNYAKRTNVYYEGHVKEN